MGLEQEIKQSKPFRNQREKAMVNLLYTYSWLNDELKDYLKPFDVTPTQYNILRILNGSECPMTTSQIRDRMLNKMSDITRLIDRLILKKFVHKKVHSIDKRLVDIEISQDGKNLLLKIYHKNQPLGSIMGNLSETESEVLNEKLDKLRNGS